MLVEAHDAAEVERALGAGARVVGVNSRNLATFAEDLGVAESLAAQLPPDVIAVAESAVRTPADAARMAAAGFDAVLVGEALVRADDPAALVRRARRRRRSDGEAELMFVKICGITNEEDALARDRARRRRVGVHLRSEHRGRSSPNGVRDIVKRLPTEVLPVGVFRNERPEHVVEVAGARRAARRAALRRRAAVGGALDPRARALRDPGVHRRRSRARARPRTRRPTSCSSTRPSPGSGKVFDWRLAEGAPGGVRLMIAGGLTPDNVGEAIRLVRPWGVDVATGVEAAPRPEGSAQAAPLHRTGGSAAGDEGGGGASLADPGWLTVEVVARRGVAS